MHYTHDQIKRSIRLLRFEMIVTSALLSIPIMVPFYLDIGMTYAQVGLSQALFTLSVVVLNIPTGWIADRVSRKACNAIGDTIVALSILWYSTVSSFGGVVAAEVVFGVGFALSRGVDASLLRSYYEALGQADLYRPIKARTTMWSIMFGVPVVVLGGFIGSIDLRLTIALSSVTFFVGAGLSMKLVEIRSRQDKPLTQENTRVLSSIKGWGATLRSSTRAMMSVVAYALHGHTKLRWSIFAAAVANESTHVQVWILTGLMLAAGIPLEIVGIGWALNSVAQTTGAFIASKLAHRLHDVQIVLVGLIGLTIGMGSVAISLNIVTVSLYAGIGLARGWYAALLEPMIQRHAPSEFHATILSIAGTVSGCLYMLCVWGFTALADVSYQLAMGGWLIAVGPTLVLAASKLRR